MGVPINAGNCMIRSTPFEPCPFDATAGPVAIKVVNKTGSVLFVSATYDGGPVTVTPQVITFNIVPGAKDLTLTFFFSDTQAGHGALHEVCPGDTFLRNVVVNDEIIRLTICGREQQ